MPPQNELVALVGVWPEYGQLAFVLVCSISPKTTTGHVAETTDATPHATQLVSVISGQFDSLE